MTPSINNNDLNELLLVPLFGSMTLKLDCIIINNKKTSYVCCQKHPSNCVIVCYRKTLFENCSSSVVINLELVYENRVKNKLHAGWRSGRESKM